MYPGSTILGTEEGPEGTFEFATFASELSAGQVPEDAFRQARKTTADTLGTAIGGTFLGATSIVADVAGTRGWQGLAGEELPGPAAAASAFALGTAASALDFDDGHYLGGAIHPASSIVPALLVAATGRDISLDDLVLAQIAGYEVGLRIAHLLWPSHEGDRYHCTGSAASVGAAVAAAKLRGADAELMARTIEIAWSYAPMAALQFPMVKEAIGWAASTATYAVRLAEAGFKAYPEGAAKTEDPDVFPATPFDEDPAIGDPFLATLGERFESAHTYLKPFSCCRYTHTAAESLRSALADGLDVAEIEEVKVGTHRGAVFLSERRPPTLEHAQYSFPFVLGAIATDGDAGPAQISADRIGDEDILGFAEKVSVEHDPAMDELFPRHYASTVTIRLKDGSEVEMQRSIAPGDEEAPLSDGKRRQKFEGLVEPVLGAGTAERLCEMLEARSGSSVAELAAALGEEPLRD